MDKKLLEYLHQIPPAFDSHIIPIAGRNLFFNF